MMRGTILFVASTLLMIGCAAAPRIQKYPTAAQLIASKTDILGDAALKQPGGASYEFFEKALPPLRYVDADFRVYPINLSAPAAKAKGRLVSNGSAINARARQPNWNHEDGTPLRVLVGAHRLPFGDDLSRLDGPHCVDGYLPIVGLRYTSVEGEQYGEEAFASVDPALAARGAVIVKFDLPGPDRGRIELRFEDGYEVLKFGDQHVLRDQTGTPLAQLDDNWDFAPARSSFMNKVKHAKTMYALVFTTAPQAPTTRATAGMAPELEAVGQATTFKSQSMIDASFYDRQRETSIRRWNETTGDIDIQLCDTGKLNSIPKAAQAPR